MDRMLKVKIQEEWHGVLAGSQKTNLIATVPTRLKVKATARWWLKSLKLKPWLGAGVNVPATNRFVMEPMRKGDVGVGW